MSSPDDHPPADDRDDDRADDRADRADSDNDSDSRSGRRPGDDDRTDWVEGLVKVAGALGMNPVRVRWKLVGWAKRWQQRKRRVEQKLDHIRYEHKHCPACRALQDRDAAVCSRCGAPMTSRARQVVGRIGLVSPRAVSISALLGVAIAVVYARTATAAGGWMSIDGWTLIRFGGNLPMGVADDEWWRPATSVFLHAGLWHLGFNLLALATVGPRIEDIFGRLPMLAMFLVTGVVAAVGSMVTGLDGVGIGASGAIMGLIGAAAGWGQRKGTSYGLQVRNDMIKWTLYVLVFGYFIGADNRAHVAGLVCGAALGYGLDPALLRGRWRPAARVVGAVAVVATMATVAAVLVPVSGLGASASRWRAPSGGTSGAMAPATPGTMVDDDEIQRELVRYEMLREQLNRVCPAAEPADWDAALARMRALDDNWPQTVRDLAAEGYTDGTERGTLMRLCADVFPIPPADDLPAGGGHAPADGEAPAAPTMTDADTPADAAPGPDAPPLAPEFAPVDTDDEP